VKLHADQLSNLHGAALAAEHGALSADHHEHTDEAGAAALAQAGTVAVLLPGAFYTLRETQVPPRRGAAPAWGAHCPGHRLQSRHPRRSRRFCSR
jgi:imidazolonepropionase-like amidohydrolase